MLSAARCAPCPSHTRVPARRCGRSEPARPASSEGAPPPRSAPFPTKQQIFFVTAPVPQVEIGGKGGRVGGGRCPPPRRLAIRGRRGGGTAPPRCRAPAAACAGGRCPVRSSAPAADQRPALTSPRVRRWARGVAPATFRRHRRLRRSARGRRESAESRSTGRPRRDAWCTCARCTSHCTGWSGEPLPGAVRRLTAPRPGGAAPAGRELPLGPADGPRDGSTHLTGAPSSRAHCSFPKFPTTGRFRRHRAPFLAVTPC